LAAFSRSTLKKARRAFETACYLNHAEIFGAVRIIHGRGANLRGKVTQAFCLVLSPADAVPNKEVH
jgi:hypothetical protein